MQYLKNYLTHKHQTTLAPGETCYTLSGHVQNILLYFLHKKLHALSCMYAEDYTNQKYRAFFELNSGDKLTCRTLLGYYFSDKAVSFF